jgi:hypothetical protein
VHILGIEMCLYDVQKSQVIILLQEGNGWKNSCALKFDMARPPLEFYYV